MKIVEYIIQTQLYVKPEITKLSPWPIRNDSDNYYIVIPTMTSVLPDNVMFVQETLIVNPHSSAQYVPKLVKLGMNLSQSYAVKIPNGIKIRLLVIDDVRSMAITESSIIKNTTTSMERQPIVHDPKDLNREDILSSIDKRIENVDQPRMRADDNSASPIVNEINLETNAPVYEHVAPPKRKRGRPPKQKVLELQEIIQ